MRRSRSAEILQHYAGLAQAQRQAEATAPRRIVSAANAAIVTLVPAVAKPLAPITAATPAWTDEDLLSVRDVAASLGCGRELVRTLIRSGELRSVRVASRSKVRRADIRAWKAAQERRSTMPK